MFPAVFKMRILDAMARTARSIWIMVVAACLPRPLSAQPPSSAESLPPAKLQECVQVGDDEARLMCYDNVLGRTPPDSAVPGGGRKGGLLDGRWELSRESKRGAFRLRPYQPVYLSPVFWTSDRNLLPHTPNPRTTVTDPQELDSLEAKFQLSFKFKMAENLWGDNVDLWGAYTQNSRWQVYNGDNSRPFRETDYEPEVMLVVRNDYGIAGWRGRMSGIGFNHQSNGLSEPLSRSWNRVMLLIGLDRENWALVLRPWWRLPEGQGDDNPDVSDYLGRGDILLAHTRHGHVFSLMGRHSLRGGGRSHGALQFEWAFPARGSLRGRLQVLHGYGESLIDYNHRATWISLGFSLVEWF